MARSISSSWHQQEAAPACGSTLRSEWVGKPTAPPMAASQDVFCRYFISLGLEFTSGLALSAVNSLRFWGSPSSFVGRPLITSRFLSELAPLGLNLSAEFLPFSFDLIPIHDEFPLIRDCQARVVYAASRPGDIDVDQRPRLLRKSGARIEVNRQRRSWWRRLLLQM